MTESIDKPNCENGVGTFQREYTAYGRTIVRCRANQTVIQQPNHLESKFVDL